MDKSSIVKTIKEKIKNSDTARNMREIIILKQKKDFGEIRTFTETLETTQRYLRRILDYFRGPDRETVNKILKDMGIKESDESYEKLNMRLHNLIGRRIKEKDFSKFFKELSSQLYKKFKEQQIKREKELSERVQNKTVQEFKEEITRSKGQLITEVITRAFSPEILTIIDRPTYELLKILYEGEKSYESLKRILNLGNNELIWRMNYLKDLEFVKPRHSYNSEFYSLSDAGKAIFEKRRAEFERLIDLIDDKVHRLSLKAVGGDKIMAEKLENWLKSGSGRGHMGVIEKLSKEYKDPKKLSQAFFEWIKEMGVNHEKHIGIKIIDHQASGELLLLTIGKSSFV